uniref:Uncharacterized protein n=1 Tax=Arundo donax TaxID=35708 RepID=A0A0A9GIU8_ARUDO
MKPKTSRCS